MGAHFIGVDVGTGSARAGVFDGAGKSLAAASHPIRIWRPHPLHAEQSSADIWQAVCASVRKAIADAAIEPGSVAGIGFDATCSLVVLDGSGNSLAVNAEGEAERDIILWMDHRARGQAERINTAGAHVLDYVGGRISPEMETPKLLWLAENLPDTFAKAGHFLDLADFLTWRSSGSLIRSTCTVTCKWTYLAHEKRWDSAYFDRIGLGSLSAADFARIGAHIADPSTRLGAGLTEQAAAELGLRVGTPVATGIIDAHAGAVGTLGAKNLPGALEDRLAYVFGTSACTLNVTKDPVFVPGVWGPYYSALIPGLWLNEGGQSAAGAAMDYLIRLHPNAGRIEEKARAAGISPIQYLEQQARELLEARAFPDIVKGLHIVPEFIGNRAPFADPDARAVIAGLGLDDDETSLVRLYLAGTASIGYGLRQILDALAGKGTTISTVVVSGGAARSALVRRILADAANITIASVDTDEPVLLGSAMLAAVAAGHVREISDAMMTMSSAHELLEPDPRYLAVHAQRYAAFQDLQAAYRQCRAV
ncbi:FGGY-family carbohydrate kinase [Methylovirgula sp. 4M-Z18]|uniref:FGGY-family carbohydrate kinase n=1 Tax=Methylovirgula sp. 4M-Z18 TaxID=2293567 RepID=UPI000E2F6219|nr:FGGY-family carbohydrate kinase [Methylovirgula sp. 4M-Z18]RFB81244.1 ribulokinase [Methylovirgula sp. 4M-Z18]